MKTYSIQQDITKYNIWVCGNDDDINCCQDQLFYPASGRKYKKIMDIHQEANVKTAALREKYKNYHEKRFMKWTLTLSAAITRSYLPPRGLSYWWRFIEDPGNEWMVLKLYAILHSKRDRQYTSFVHSKCQQIGWFFYSYVYKWFQSFNVSLHHLKYTVDLSRKKNYFTLYKNEHIGLFFVTQVVDRPSVERNVIIQSCNSRFSDVKFVTAIKTLQVSLYIYFIKSMSI